MIQLEKLLEKCTMNSSKFIKIVLNFSLHPFAFCMKHFSEVIFLLQNFPLQEFCVDRIRHVWVDHVIGAASGWKYIFFN